MKEIIKVSLLFVLAFTIFILFLSGMMYMSDKPYQDACEEAGYESYNGIFGGISYCEDIDNNLYTVKFIKEGTFKAKVKNIKIYNHDDGVKGK